MPRWCLAQKYTVVHGNEAELPFRRVPNVHEPIAVAIRFVITINQYRIKMNGFWYNLRALCFYDQMSIYFWVLNSKVDEVNKFK